MSKKLKFTKPHDAPYNAPKVSGYVLHDEMGMTSCVNTAEGWNINKDSDGLVFKTKRKFWLSIRKAKNCLFSRRNGKFGKLIWGYSVCLRLFGKTIL